MSKILDHNFSDKWKTIIFLCYFWNSPNKIMLEGSIIILDLLVLSFKIKQILDRSLFLDSCGINLFVLLREYHLLPVRKIYFLLEKLFSNLICKKWNFVNGLRYKNIIQNKSHDHHTILQTPWPPGKAEERTWNSNWNQCQKRE